METEYQWTMANGGRLVVLSPVEPEESLSGRYTDFLFTKRLINHRWEVNAFLRRHPEWRFEQ